MDDCSDGKEWADKDEDGYEEVRYNTKRKGSNILLPKKNNSEIRIKKRLRAEVEESSVQRKEEMEFKAILEFENKEESNPIKFWCS